MNKPYEQLKLEIYLFPTDDIVATSGDNYEDDPWDGFSY